MSWFRVPGRPVAHWEYDIRRSPAGQPIGPGTTWTHEAACHRLAIVRTPDDDWDATVQYVLPDELRAGALNPRWRTGPHSEGPIRPCLKCLGKLRWWALVDP